MSLTDTAISQSGALATSIIVPDHCPQRVGLSLTWYGASDCWQIAARLSTFVTTTILYIIFMGSFNSGEKRKGLQHAGVQCKRIYKQNVSNKLLTCLNKAQLYLTRFIQKDCANKVNCIIHEISPPTTDSAWLTISNTLSVNLGEPSILLMRNSWKGSTFSSCFPLSFKTN